MSSRKILKGTVNSVEPSFSLLRSLTRTARSSVSLLSCQTRQGISNSVDSDYIVNRHDSGIKFGA